MGRWPTASLGGCWPSGWAGQIRVPGGQPGPVPSEKPTRPMVRAHLVWGDCPALPQRNWCLLNVMAISSGGRSYSTRCLCLVWVQINTRVYNRRSQLNPGVVTCGSQASLSFQQLLILSPSHSHPNWFWQDLEGIQATWDQLHTTHKCM